MQIRLSGSLKFKEIQNEGTWLLQPQRRGRQHQFAAQTQKKTKILCKTVQVQIQKHSTRPHDDIPNIWYKDTETITIKTNKTDKKTRCRIYVITTTTRIYLKHIGSNITIQNQYLVWPSFDGSTSLYWELRTGLLFLKSENCQFFRQVNQTVSSPTLDSEKHFHEAPAITVSWPDKPTDVNYRKAFCAKNSLSSAPKTTQGLTGRSL